MILGLFTGLRRATRALARRPAYAVIAIGAVAFAAALNALVGAIVYGVAFKPLPYPKPDRLVRLFDSSLVEPRFPVSVGLYEEYKRDASLFTSVSLYMQKDLQLMRGNEADRITAMRITPDYFETLGVGLYLGRTFETSEAIDEPRVLILSYSIWASRFDRDPQIVGKTVRINREAWTVVGVAQRGVQHVGGSYRSPMQGDTVSAWWPLSLKLDDETRWRNHYTNAVARLNPGVSLEQARARTNQIAAGVARRLPAWRGTFGAAVEPLDKTVVGDSSSTVAMLFGAGLTVLLIAAMNVAALSVARVIDRQGEFTLQRALGARGWHLFRQLLAESLVVGIAGGMTGILAAHGSFALFKHLLPSAFPRVHDIEVTWTVDAWAFASAVAATVIAGTVAGVRHLASDGNLKLESSRTSSTSRSMVRLRSLLIAGEVAVACTVCVIAALFLRSAQQIQQRRHGFNPESVLTFTVALPSAANTLMAPTSAYGGREQMRLLYGRLLEGLAAIPGVTAAGASNGLPWGTDHEMTLFEIEGRPSPDTNQAAAYQVASPDYFKALQVRIVQGRGIEDGDVATAGRVVVINEAFARMHFPNESPLGHWLKTWNTRRQIVGVVADVFDSPATNHAAATYWMPLDQLPPTQIRVALRSAVSPASLAASAARALREIDPELPMTDVRTMAAIEDAALGERRFVTILFETFSIAAVIIAAIGIYGLMSFVISARSKDIAIRVALGGRPGQAIGSVLRHSTAYLLAGAAAGVVMAPVIARFLSGSLYGVTALDVRSLIMGPTVVILAAIGASIAPMLHATRVHPSSVLRAT